MTSQNSTPDGPFEVFFDGDCPLCLKEINWLRKRVIKKNRAHEILFTDIADASFSPEEVGKSFDELMAEIHGRLPNGQWVIGVEVFRRLYASAGFGLPVRISRWFGVRHSLDLGYRVFAKYRTRLTGRCKNGSCQTSSSANVNSSL